MTEGASLLQIPREEKQESTQLHPLLLNNEIPLLKQDATPHPLLRGPRRVARLCVCAVLVPAVLITVPLYVRLVLYQPVQYPMMPTDQRLTGSLVSSFWCQSQWVHMNSSFNVYSSTTPFHTTPPRPALHLLHSATLRDDEKEYWGFHLLQGSTVTVSACATNDGGQIMILRGVDNLRRCAWIRQAASKEEVKDEDEDGLKDDNTHLIHHPFHVDGGGGRVGDGEWMQVGAPFVEEDGEMVVDEGDWVEEEEEGERVEQGGGLLHNYHMDGGLVDVEKDGERVEGGGATTDEEQVEDMEIMKVEDDEEIQVESGNTSENFRLEKGGASLNITTVDEDGVSSSQSTQPLSTFAPLNERQGAPSPSRLRNQGTGPKDPFSDPHNSTQDQNEDQQREFSNTDHYQDENTEFKTTNQTQERPDQPQDRHTELKTTDQNQEKTEQNQDRPDQNQDRHRDFSHTDQFQDRHKEILAPDRNPGRPDQPQDRDFSHSYQNQDRQRGFQSPDRSQEQRGYRHQTRDQSEERERDLVKLLRRVLRLSKNKKEILRILHSLGRSESRQLPKHIQRKLGIQPETQDNQDTTRRDRRAANKDKKEILAAIHSLGSSDIKTGQAMRPETPDNHVFTRRHRREVHNTDEDGAFEEYDDDDDDDDVPVGGAGKRSRLPDGDGGRRSRGHAAVKDQVRSKVEGQVGSKLMLPEGWFKVERGYFKHRNKDDMSDEENVSSFSSSEEALAACDGVVATLPLRAYRGCSRKWVGMNKAVYEVPKNANYYLVVWSDNEIATNTLHFNLSLARVQYDTRDATLICHNSTQCSVPLSFFAHTYVLVEVPSDASYLSHAILHTSCQSRVPVFLVFLISAPLLILFCAFQ